MRNGTLCAIIANVNRDSKKQKEPFQPKDFMHFVETQEQESEKELTPEEVDKHLERIFGK